MYTNLTNAMGQRGVTQRAVATVLGRHYNTVHKKMSGKCDFEVGEAKLIHRTWFPDMDFAELFADARPSPADPTSPAPASIAHKKQFGKGGAR